MTENEIGTSILKHAYDIHTELGPGLLESVYEVILAHALQNEGISVERQKAVPITYKGLKFNEGFRADVIAESKVIIEFKSVEALLPVHAKQLLTYLKLLGIAPWLLNQFSRAASQSRNQANRQPSRDLIVARDPSALLSDLCARPFSSIARQRGRRGSRRGRSSAG